MARLRGALHSDYANGAFGKAMIFRSSMQGQTVSGYYKPGSKKPFTPSPAQFAQRLKYGQAVEAWKALTDEQKNVYNDRAFKLTHQISGWNLFMKQFVPVVLISDLLLETGYYLLLQNGDKISL